MVLDEVNLEVTVDRESKKYQVWTLVPSKMLWEGYELSKEKDVKNQIKSTTRRLKCVRS